MEATIILGGIIVIGVIAYIISLRKELRDNAELISQLYRERRAAHLSPDYEPADGAETDTDSGNDIDEKQPAYRIMMEALKEIGCQPEEKDGDIHVQYQGENIYIECSGYYARIIDPGWSSIKNEDPNFGIVREAMNITNFHFGPTIIMTTADSDGCHLLHSRVDMMLHPSNPHNHLYVQATLNSLFDTKREFESRIRLLLTNPPEGAPIDTSFNFNSINCN